MRPGVRYGIAEPQSRVWLIQPAGVRARPPARKGGACADAMSCVGVAPWPVTTKGIVRLPATPVLPAPSPPCPPCDAEGIVRLPATCSEPSAQSRSCVDEIVVKVPVAGNDPIPTL